jgi:hypothetical protein
MALPFLNRKNEISRLKKALSSKGTDLLVVYGRRRCGKSTLLQKVAGPQDIYYLADQNEKAIQIRLLAGEISRVIPEFGAATYSDWDALFSVFAAQSSNTGALVLDEFPYLVQTSPELPSIIQKYMDRKSGAHIVICGSSQRMMQGMALDSSSPLFGRSREIMKIRPLEAGWIAKAFKEHDPSRCIELFAFWGGVPRYWELAVEYNDNDTALKELIFNRDGVLHDEPHRLLMDDMRSAAQPHAILSLVGAGCHRLSEIASRLGKPAGNLSRPLENLIDLGYVMREMPFGENTRSTKRTLYKIDDPFISFWYRFIHPNASLLEKGMADSVFSSCRQTFASHTAHVWEVLARNSTAHLKADGMTWNPGTRWWGNDVNGNPCEVDVVAESLDGKHLLIGEAKWEKHTAPEAVQQRLETLAKTLPFVRGRKIHFACWAKKAQASKPSGISVFSPRDVLKQQE